MSDSDSRVTIDRRPGVLALTPGDKRKAILLALKAWPDRSAHQIASQVGVSQPYVTELREQVKGSYHLPPRVTGKDGKS